MSPEKKSESNATAGTVVGASFNSAVAVSSACTATCGATVPTTVIDRHIAHAIMNELIFLICFSPFLSLK